MKVRKELWFGFGLIALILIPVIALTPWTHLTNGHLGLLMLALICVGIMLGFPTAFTLMGMGVGFAWLYYAAWIRRLPIGRSSTCSCSAPTASCRTTC